MCVLWQTGDSGVSHGHTGFFPASIACLSLPPCLTGGLHPPLPVSQVGSTRLSLSHRWAPPASPCLTGTGGLHPPLPVSQVGSTRLSLSHRYRWVCCTACPSMPSLSHRYRWVCCTACHSMPSLSHRYRWAVRPAPPCPPCLTGTGGLYGLPLHAPQVQVGCTASPSMLSLSHRWASHKP